MNKKVYLFANWKMYLNADESVSLAREFVKLKYPAESAIAVFPSATSINEVIKILKKGKFFVGPQSTFWADKGGYTGEISSAEYKQMGCTHALVGHAERRHIFHETNHDVRLKMESLLQLSITPILCVGETSDEKNDNKTTEVLEAQIRSAYMDITWPEGVEPIIAYEPVWAVGTGMSCDPKEAEAMCATISDWAEQLLHRKPVVLYGGSVRGENIAEYVSEPHISGVLVGGASAKIDTWAELVKNLM